MTFSTNNEVSYILLKKIIQYYPHEIQMIYENNIPHVCFQNKKVGVLKNHQKKVKDIISESKRLKS
jgi:hypothetical protein